MMGRYDAIVIGAGHNGLTAAGLLAKRGQRVLVLERSDAPGGVAASDEFHPGYRSVGLFHDTRGVRPGIADALGLEAHGLSFRREAPEILALGEGGTGFMVPSGIEEVSARDAGRYAEYVGFLDRVRPVLSSFVNEPPVNLVEIESVGAWNLMKRGLQLRRLGRADMLELMRLPPMCVADWLDEWFETDLLKGVLSVPAVAGTFMGPWSPGTNANLLLLEAAAGAGVEGGGPALVRALVAAAEAHGAEIRTDAEVTAIRVEAGVARGVDVGDESIDAPLIVAACDPKRAMLELLPPALLDYRVEHRLLNFRTKGTTAHVLLAVDGKVRFAAEPEGDIEFARTGAHLDDVERAFDAVKYRRVSPTPVLDIHVPTVAQPDFAPDGHSVVSLAVHFAPHDLEGGWTNAARDALGDRVVDVLASHVPGIREAIVARSVRTPADLEARYGLTGGHIHHGEHALDQLLIRPTPDCAEYRTPVEGLVLASSGTHPGGGLTCAPGALAVAER